MESSFIELRCKEVVNILDGRKLGHIVDIVFDLCGGRILGVVVPGEKTGWSFFKTTSQLFIPYGCITKIGEDAILIDMPGQTPPINPYILSNKDSKK